MLKQLLIVINDDHESLLNDFRDLNSINDTLDIQGLSVNFKAGDCEMTEVPSVEMEVTISYV